MRTMRIIYYLSREGQLEEPHLLEVPVATPNSKGLHLIDVKRWLMLTRGTSMPGSFSWSYRRNYREGCIWQDVSADEDLILPASEDEYILKGSKVLVASKELCWPAPVFAKLDQNAYSMHNDHDCPVRVKEDFLSEGSKELHARNEQVVNVAEGSNGICDQHITLVDASSPCLMVENWPHTKSESLISETVRTLEHACQNGKRQETKSQRVSGDSSMESQHVSRPKALTGTTCKVIQAKGVTTHSQTNKQVVDVNVAENARLLNTVGNHNKCQTTGSHVSADNERSLQTVDNHMNRNTIGSDEGDEQSKLNVMQDATLLRTVNNHIKCQTNNKHLMCGAPCDANESVEVASVSKDLKRVPCQAIRLKTNGYWTPASSRAKICPSVKKRPDSKQTMHTKLKSSLEHASYKAVNANMTDCEVKQTKHADKPVVMRRMIKTNWGCRYTPLQFTHVKAYNIGAISACKPHLPPSNSTAENVLWATGDKRTVQDKKSYHERVSYSDEQGVQLPATMVIKDVAVHMAEPLCPFHQRLLTKQAPLSSTLTPAYNHKKATSQYLPKKTSLPVFGWEKRQQKLLEELDSFRIESGMSDMSFTKNPSQSQLTCMQQACNVLQHEENSYPVNPVVHNHDRAILSRNVSRKDTKSLWEELLQTTQDALTHQETI